MATLIALDDDLSEQIDRLAQERGVSRGTVMREAICQFVERGRARDDFFREADESWSEFQRTGQHITVSELSDWLATWGTEAEAGPPDCHE